MQHEYTATVAWTRNGEVFSDGRYSRGHVWRFDGGIEVAASSSPSVVPLPMSREDAVDPEEAFVAALSSCHMLTFLAIAGKKRLIVDRYEDKAVGIMSKNAERQTLRVEGHARSGHRILRRQDTVRRAARRTSSSVSSGMLHRQFGPHGRCRRGHSLALAP